MKVLITGCLGYIGKHLMRYMGGHDLEGIDLETDITDIKLLDEAFNRIKPDVVIHTAGLKSVSESFIVPHLYEYVNVQGTKNILECMKKYGTKSIIFSSSATVYEDDTNEDSNLKSINPYGQTKIDAEHAIINSGLNYCILRYFNPVGSDEDISSPNLFPTCIRTYHNNKNDNGNDVDGNASHNINIYGNCVRDYFYVIDLASFHNVLLTKGFDHLIMNFGTGTGMTTSEFVTLFEETNGLTLNKNYLPKRDGDKEISVANVNKFRSLFPEFQFTPKNIWLKIVPIH